MIITKSLFVEFSTNPKLARRHANDKPTYTLISDTKHAAMDWEAIWKAVEYMVLSTYIWQEITSVDRNGTWVSSQHQNYHTRTEQALTSAPSVLYQPAFLYWETFAMCDILVRNDIGTYDLVEVKAKNSIYKKTKVAPLLDELVADVSIQAYVLKKVMWDQFSWTVYIAHLDAEYIKNGPINPSLIVIQEEVTSELMSDDLVELILKSMKEALALSSEQFDARYPYEGKDYMTYFGTKPPKDSIWSLTRLGGKKKAEFHEQWKIMLKDFDMSDLESLYNKKGEPTKASSCLNLWMNWPETIDTVALEEELGLLKYPLYFYDYETINGPIPAIEWTSPRQQVVVQYSLHKFQSDGTYSHHEDIIRPGETSNLRILKNMIHDMDGCKHGTYIVRYKWFENSRNNERALMHPDYAKNLAFINDHTFDLMEIFSNQIYYHRDFQGSSSIKKVLPVMSDISYKGYAVPNGAVAMEQLSKIVSNTLDKEEVTEITKNLLEYCKLDTWAMVKIREKLREYV